MPVVALSYDRLVGLVGTSAQKIRECLPYLGLDIEHEDGDTVRVEYSPNRPDYSTEYGISLGLQGMLGISTGLYDLDVRDSDRHILASGGVRRVRGCITAIAAIGGYLDDHSIKQIISMQEDLHQGLGRRRAKLAIGLHDMDKLKFPLSYDVRDREFAFPPLGSDTSMPIRDILQKTEQGRTYGHLLARGPVPVILDAQGKVASMPPVINSSHTTITSSTRNILVDVTGHAAAPIENALAVVCVTLQAAGFSLERICISGAGNTTPALSSRTMDVDHTLANRTLGLDMTRNQTVQCLLKSRLGAQTSQNMIRCTIPSYRFDMMGDMDIVEEVALGYGIYNMEPTLPPANHTGRASTLSRNLQYIGNMMTGLGYMEVINSSLTGHDTASHSYGTGNPIKVSNPKSQNHTILRHGIIPGLLENLSSNIHESYPHRLYETGAVFDTVQGRIRESLHLGCVTAHKNASYSEIKSVLYAICTDMGLELATPPLDAKPFSAGRAAAIHISGSMAGMLGEISSDARESFRIRDGVAVSALELDLGLIFEMNAGISTP